MPITSAGAVAARLDRLPFSRTLRRMVFLISLGGGFEFYDLFLTAYIAPGLVSSGLFTSTSKSLLDTMGVGFFVFATFAGMFVGAMGFGFIADRMGRRPIFVVSLVAYSVATAIMALQHKAAGVALWRFIASIGVGVEQVTIDTFLPEFVPPTSRGRAFAFNEFIQFSFVPVVALLGWLLVPRHPFGFEGWRWVTLVGSVGALLAWSLRLGLPESPRWLAEHGHSDEAERTLREIEMCVERDTGAPLPDPAEAGRAVAGSAASFAEIFRPPYGRRALVMSIFNLMQSIAFYGFGSWVPTLLIAKGVRVTTSLEYAFIIAVANPVGPLLGLFVADRMERKWQIVSAGVAIGVSILLFANQSNTALVIAFGVLVTLANNWMSFAFHNYQGELFPTRIRARAVGFVYSWSRVSAAIAGLLIGFFLREGGTPGVALFIGAAMLVMIVTIGGFGPRTKGLPLEDI
jgi:MFS transporter, putative metabolite:H+ symporter